MNKEFRHFDIEFRADADSRHIEGYGAVFNKRSVDLGGFTEIIAPGAFDGVVERSDVLALLDHNQDRGILARSTNGEGSLKLELTEEGLKYAFDAPHTQLGDEVVEGLRRGDYSKSSFAFTVKEEAWSKLDDGSYLRTINKIGNLYDVSVVARPAYEDTSVALRSLDAFKASEEQPEVPVEEPKEEPVEEVKEAPVVEEVKEETKEEVQVVTEDGPQERNNTKTNKRMSNFSLIKAINDVVNNRNINEDALSVIEMGAKEMRKSGLSFSGQIQLPIEERDAKPTDGAIVATVEGQGNEIVATEKLNILDPLYNNSVLSEVGATFMTGLVGNVSIPTYSGSTVGWKGEMAEADNGMGAFDSVELSPKRLTAFIDISKQFLVQDSVGAEEMLKRDIIKAISQKLEATVFGSAAGDTTKPAGIFNGAAEAAPSYDAVVDLEEELEGANFNGDKVFIMSPAAKAAFKRATVSGEKSDLRLLLEDGEVDGYKVVASNAVAGYALGDFSELIVAQWGALDLTIDPYTLATKGAIRIVVNAYFDAVVRREGAIVAKMLPTA